MGNNSKLYAVVGQFVHLTNGHIVDSVKIPLSNYFYECNDAKTYMRHIIESQLPDDCMEFYAFVDKTHPGGVAVSKEDALTPTLNPEGVLGITFYAKRKNCSVVYVMAEVCELIPRILN